MKSDVIFFLSVIGFFFILWFATGGPTRPISFAGPYITPITDVGTISTGYGSNQSTAGFYTGGGLWSSIMGLEDQVADLQRDASDIRAFGEASPLKGQVRVSSTGVGATDPDQEYVTLRVTGSQSVDITGWRLVSGASGRGARIPEGTALPKRGRVNDTGRIVLNPGDTAIVVTGEGPNGVSFRENMCTGYLQESQRYYPALENRCPAPYDEFDRFFTGNELRDQKCYDLMRSSRTCVTPSDRGVSSACSRLIDEYLTYTGCVEKHQNDSRFPGTTWHIYLEYENGRGKDAELWKSSRDAIKLLDADGRTVDLYTY